MTTVRYPEIEAAGGTSTRLLTSVQMTIKNKK